MPSLFAIYGRRQANKNKQENENSIPRERHLSQDTEYSKRNIYVNTLLKIKQKKKTIRGAVFVRRLRLVAYIQRMLLVVLLPNGGRKWLKIIRIE